ncbi:SMC-Scp complex subunit ScpB [Kushneria aurantia]|uniref:SMC-Scp complex subunit ScpB n=1 Tax=Kushneria aurantia TaxID=504092 RepID=A0ABV6G290_9GAMM
MSLERLEAVFEESERPGRRALREALERLERRLEESALMLEESASGFRLRVRDALSPWVSRLWDERPQRYSRALLETLALIAYRQPVTRADIEEVRGVSVSASIMRTLVERGWVRVIGHRDVPGRPAVYATTRSFLDDFGLRTLDALPPMSAVREGETVDWLEQASPPDSGAESEAEAPGEGDSENGDEAAPAAQQDSDLRGIGDRLEERLRRAERDEQTPDEGDGSATPPNESAD